MSAFVIFITFPLLAAVITIATVRQDQRVETPGTPANAPPPTPTWTQNDIAAVVRAALRNRHPDRDEPTPRPHLLQSASEPFRALCPQPEPFRPSSHPTPHCATPNPRGNRYDRAQTDL